LVCCWVQHLGGTKQTDTLQFELPLRMPRTVHLCERETPASSIVPGRCWPAKRFQRWPTARRHRVNATRVPALDWFWRRTGLQRAHQARKRRRQSCRATSSSSGAAAPRIGCKVAGNGRSFAQSHHVKAHRKVAPRSDGTRDDHSLSVCWGELCTAFWNVESSLFLGVGWRFDLLSLSFLPMARSLLNLPAWAQVLSGTSSAAEEESPRDEPPL
jgi:hypothetical protein